MVIKTLLEKLDSSQPEISLKQSVCNQVQRIISTRMYLGAEPVFHSWVTGFGTPQIVDEYSHVGNQHERYQQLLREKILAFEPRVNEVKVKRLKNYSDRLYCHLVLSLDHIEIEEKFFF